MNRNTRLYATCLSAQSGRAGLLFEGQVGMGAVLFAFLTIVGVASVQAGSGADSPFVGTWALNVSRSKLPSNYPYRSMTLQFAVVLDTVTIGTTFVTTSGREQSATELFHLDGKEHPGTLSPGVVQIGTWINSRMIETRATKNGQDVGVITYEISADGRTLTQKYSGTPDHTLVFERAGAR